MAYDRNTRDNGPRDFDNGRDYRGPGARDYAGGGDGGRDDYGAREYGNQSYRRYDQPNRYPRGQREGYGSQEQWGGGQRDGHGSHASDGRHFEDVDRYRDAGDDRGGRYQQLSRGDGRQSQGYDHDDRGFIARAGDEVRSWFGDEDAERRREADARYDERHDRSGGHRHDDDYRQWRNSQMSQLDRDYHEYRQENRAKFENEFASWRTTRQSQRELLRQVKEHAEVVGSDGQRIGTVDKARDDRIILTKNDAEAGGRHHSIPSRWIGSVEGGKVTLSKTAAEAKAAWEDEDRNAAMSAERDGQRSRERDLHDAAEGGRDAQGRMLNRSFSGTY